MSKLNRDVLYLIFQELHDKKFCKHLNFKQIVRILDICIPFKEHKKIKNEIIGLFINENTKFTHLYIPIQFEFQIHLIPGAQHCFSELEFLSCNTDDVLAGLTEICKSIKILELTIGQFNNKSEIVRLIEIPKKLSHICLTLYHESQCKILENSMMKRANAIKHFKITNSSKLSSFVNLISTFVNLRILELDVLASLIENTSGSLIEIKIYYYGYNIDNENNKRIIQAIYQNCPNLKYLKLLIRNSNIVELEQLLINSRSSPTSRHPMLLQLMSFTFNCIDLMDLIETYKREGIIKKCGISRIIADEYSEYQIREDFEDFEWIQNKVFWQTQQT
ncbi:hypothetical protein C1645_838951 [Glomus cerebriforme]|uniref:F-box domain-containing protein n=1 Tax=Glomus cerebriforme TaxID=658196 RepID=A0A397S7J8_9GLOM|nr:hypothetical protein C1645_838951 [Glomus cerebriforme]